jgi:ABC-2 type transport system ATP-binding protein
MSDIILKVNGLEKKYKSVHALKGVSFEVERGMIFGLLGPNGSGKTTTLAMLLGILHPTKGNFEWFGNGNDTSNRKRIGALLETPNFYPYLNAFDNLKVVAKIKEMENPDQRIKEVLEQVDLLERGKRSFRSYSLGMKQRLAVASALLSDPEVLVLDEPTNGLDPRGIIEMRELITDIAKAGKTIIIASHILDEIEKICTHVAILKEGTLLANESLLDFLKQRNTYVVAAENMQELGNLVDTTLAFTLIENNTQSLIIEATQDMNGAAINKLFVEKGIYLSTLQPYQKSLETLFLETVS